MKAKSYFLYMFALVLLTAGIVGLVWAPQVTAQVAGCVFGLVIFVGICMIWAGVAMMLGPQEEP